MFNPKKTHALKKMLFSKGSETDKMISAGVVRTILADITRLFFENKKAKGPGILVFNAEDPERSIYATRTDIENDIAMAEEACSEEFADAFKSVLKIVERESRSDLALVAMVYDDGLAVNVIDPKEINETIDEILKQSD